MAVEANYYYKSLSKFKHDILPKWSISTWYSIFDLINILKDCSRRIKSHIQGLLKKFVEKISSYFITIYKLKRLGVFYHV